MSVYVGFYALVGRLGKSFRKIAYLPNMNMCSGLSLQAKEPGIWRGSEIFSETGKLELRSICWNSTYDKSEYLIRRIELHWKILTHVHRSRWPSDGRTSIRQINLS